MTPPPRDEFPRWPSGIRAWIEDTFLLLGIAMVGVCVVYGLALIGWVVFQCLFR